MMNGGNSANGHGIWGRVGLCIAVYVACPLAVLTISSLSGLTLKHHEEITRLQDREEMHAREIADIKAQQNRMETKLDRLLERR